jgi:hypothetical protein
MELEGRKSIFSTPPHPWWDPQVICNEEKIMLKECRQRVRRYNILLGHEESRNCIDQSNPRDRKFDLKAGNI